jgi:5'(3')-deoxyribonucleotidase
MTNPSKPKIAVDVDGVLANIYDPIFTLLGRKELSSRDVKSWDFFADLQIDRRAFWGAYKRLWSEEFYTIPLIEKDSPKILAELRRSFEIHIVTSRPAETHIGTIRWLEYHQICYDKIIFLLPSADKTKMLSLDNYLCLVDDNPAFAKDERVILFDQPWNQGVKAMRRIRSLKELLDILPTTIESSPPQRGCSRGAPP